MLNESLIGGADRRVFVRLCCLVVSRWGKELRSLGRRAAGGKTRADEVINRGLAAIVSILAAAGVWLLPAAAAEEGVAADRILFGQSAALTGPAAELGLEMQRGILAAFGEANAAGGIAGRQIELITRDDRYEPEAAIANTEALIGEDRVFGLIGAVGTPTSAATEPIAQEAGVPFIAPFTGAEFLRDPSLTNVVNIRASYFEETEAIVDRLVADRGVTPDRGALPGRFLRAERPRRGQAGARAAEHDAGRRRHLCPQHDGGEDGAPRPPRRAARGDHRHRRIPSERRVHAMGAEARGRRHHRQHLLRRRQCAGRGPRPGRRRGLRDPGGAVPRRRRDAAACGVPGGARRPRPGRQARASARSRATSPGA